MPLNLGFLALPLLGGFVFMSTSNAFRFEAERYSGYRLFFTSAVAGAFLLGLSYLVVLFLRWIWPGLASTWETYVYFRHSGTATGAFILGASGGYISNGAVYGLRYLWYDCLEKDGKPWDDFAEWVDAFRYRRERDHRGLLKEAEKSIARSGNSFEQLLARALREDKQVFVTMTTSKVYIGYVLANFHPGKERDYVSILKVLSGYRHKVSREFKLTTVYHDVRNIAAEQYDHLDDHDDFKIVIPVSMIASINIFDEEVFDHFQELGN